MLEFKALEKVCRRRFGRSMEKSVLASVSWNWQPEICKKVYKKQAKVLIWDRPKVEGVSIYLSGPIVETKISE